MKAQGIDPETWENTAADLSRWRGAQKKQFMIGEGESKTCLRTRGSDGRLALQHPILAFQHSMLTPAPNEKVYVAPGLASPFTAEVAPVSGLPWAPD